MRFRLAPVAVSVILPASVARGEEITYTRHIQPLVAERCADCHGKEGAPDYYAFKVEKEKWISAAKADVDNDEAHAVEPPFGTIAILKGISASRRSPLFRENGPSG